MHVVSLHNDPAGSQLGKVVKERMHSHMFQDAARVGAQPVFICVDTNSKKSEVIDAAIAT